MMSHSTHSKITKFNWMSIETINREKYSYWSRRQVDTDRLKYDVSFVLWFCFSYIPDMHTPLCCSSTHPQLHKIYSELFSNLFVVAIYRGWDNLIRNVLPTCFAIIIFCFSYFGFLLSTCSFHKIKLQCNLQCGMNSVWHEYVIIHSNGKIAMVSVSVIHLKSSTYWQ